MNTPDLATIVSAVVAVITLVLSVIVYIQNRKHDRVIDKRNESYHADAVEETATKFLHQHHDDLPYLPLAYIALLYDSNRNYERPIYSSLHTQSREVQAAIAKKFELLELTKHRDNFYNVCYQKTLSLFNAKGASDEGDCMMHDSGKYWTRTLTHHGNKPLLIDYRDVVLITDVLSGQCMTISNPISYIVDKLQLRNCNEDRCCQYMCIIIYYLAVYADNDDNEIEFDTTDLDDAWAMSDNLTSEDLFLMSLFKIYCHVLNDGVKRRCKHE